MPPTVRTPWFPAGCVLGVVLVVLVVLVGPAAAEPLPPEPAFAPELVGALELVFAAEPVFPPALVLPPELVFTAEALWPAGGAPLLATCAPDGLPLLAGVGVPDT